MASYRVFERLEASPETKAAGENVRFIRDGFSYLAIIFPFLWLLWHRLWIAIAAFLFLTGFFILLSEWTTPSLLFFLNALLALYLGFEGTNLRAMKLVNYGWKETGLIIAGDAEEAELRFFMRRDSEDAMSGAVAPDLAVSHSAMPHGTRSLQSLTKPRTIIGGFPPHPSGSRS